MLQILNAEISILGIVIAVVANTVIGMVWYGPLFGKQWMKALGKKMGDAKAKPMDYAYTLAAAAIAATFMSLLVSYGFVNSQFMGLANAFGAEGASDFILSGTWSDIASGLVIGLFVWLASAVPLLANRMVWEGTDKKFLAINAGFSIVSMLTMGVIVALAMNLS